MPLESGLFVQDLVETNPPGTDQKLQGDDHLRLLKTVLKNTFPDANRAIRLKRVVTNLSSNYTVDATDENKLLKVNANAAAIDITLPSPSAVGNGWSIAIKKSDSSPNAVRINGTNIDGIAGTKSLFSANESVIITTEGVDWFIVASHQEGSSVTIKTDTYSVIAADNGSTLIAKTNDVDFNLPPVAQVPNGWRINLKNNSTKKVRAVPSGGELIDGLSQTPSIASFTIMSIVSAGTEWIIVNRGPDVGHIIMFGSVNPPQGYIACNDTPVSRTDFSGLFFAIGENYGTGDGSTTFGLPKAPSRGPIGQGQSGSLTNRELLDTGGEESHIQTIAEMPTHSHNNTVNTLSEQGPGGSGSQGTLNANNFTSALTDANTGGGTPFNVMDPFFVVKFCIKT